MTTNVLKIIRNFKILFIQFSTNFTTIVLFRFDPSSVDICSCSGGKLWRSINMKLIQLVTKTQTVYNIQLMDGDNIKGYDLRSSQTFRRRGIWRLKWSFFSMSNFLVRPTSHFSVSCEISGLFLVFYFRDISFASGTLSRTYLYVWCMLIFCVNHT